MDDLYTLMKAAVGEIIAQYKALAADGSFSFADAWSLGVSATATFMRVAESFANYDGAAKKAAVLKSLGDFYDQVVAPLDIPAVPEFFEKSFVDPAMRALLLKAAEGTIDALTGIFNRIGWSDGGTSPNPDGHAAAAIVPFGVAA